MRKRVFHFFKVLVTFICIFLFVSKSVYAAETQLVDDTEPQIEVEVGQDENGNTTVTYGKYVFVRKYNGWYIPATYIYDGSDLDNFLDSVIIGTRRTSVRCDGFLFVKISGGWYRHELHFNDGRFLAEQFNKAAGITTTYNPNGNITTDENTDVTGR